MSIGSFEGYVDDRLAEIQFGLNVVRPSQNQPLFRYIALNSKTSWGYLETTLNEFKLHGALASSLNDPFEQNPCVFDDLSPSLLEKFRQSKSLLETRADQQHSIQQIEKFRKGAFEFLNEEILILG